ncbi:MAG: YceI family protein, partial [Lysobacteraceae bacterium]
MSLLAGLLLAGHAHAGDLAHYRLDPVHTRVLFAIEHAGFSHALGTVSGTTGTLDFDAGDWTTARLHASVPLTRADLGDAAWN